MKDAYYFSHDSNAKDDPKCIMLIEQLGLEGYGIFWILVETLRDQPMYRYPLTLLPALARRFNTTSDKMKVVVSNYGLFQVEDEEFFFSQSLRSRMEDYDRKRELARIAGKKSAQKRLLLNDGSTDVQRTFNDCSTSIVKESKAKESKEKKKDINNIGLVDSFSDNELLKRAINEFIKMRIKIKKPMTDHALKLMLDELQNLSSDENTQIQILNQSITHCWQTVYKLKGDDVVGGNTENNKPTKYSNIDKSGFLAKIPV